VSQGQNFFRQNFSTHIANTRKYIVGAGVSTCAPTVIE